jgi:hypothetical protein
VSCKQAMCDRFILLRSKLRTMCPESRLLYSIVYYAYFPSTFLMRFRTLYRSCSLCVMNSVNSQRKKHPGETAHHISRELVLFIFHQKKVRPILFCFSYQLSYKTSTIPAKFDNDRSNHRLTARVRRDCPDP